jgi:hypothetical protein
MIDHARILHDMVGDHRQVAYVPLPATADVAQHWLRGQRPR